MAAKTAKHINLLPKEDFERTTLGRIMKWALTSFRFIVITVEFVVIAGFLFRFWLDIQISNQDDEITQKSALISSKSSFEQSFRSVQAKTMIFQEITKNENLSLPIIKSITDSLPPDSQILSITREEDLVSIEGASLNESSISAFIANLKDKDNVNNASLSEISTAESSPLVKFRMTISLSSTTI